MPFSTRVVPRDGVLTDVDGDGQVEVDLGKDVPPTSVWAFVDLQDGRVALGTPEDSPATQIQLASTSLPPNARGELDTLLDRRETLEVLVARPGTGAWRLTVVEGGRSDADLEDNDQVTVDFAEAEPLGDTRKSLRSLHNGDVLIGIDTSSLEYFAVTIEPNSQEG